MTPPESTTLEVWKPVVSWEGIYEVSSQGKLRRLFRRNGRGPGLLHGCVSFYGYRQIMLREQGRKQQIYLHQIVAAAFLGPCPKGCNVNHKDGVKSNNHLENLEYVTNEENVRHAHRNGLVPYARGESHGRAKYSDEVAMRIVQMIKAGHSNKKIAETLGVGPNTVSYIRMKKRRAYLWDHIAAPSARD